MKRLFTFIFALISIANIWAAKSAGTPMLVFQPDGLTVTIQLLGDEGFSWYQTADGVLLVREDNSYYVAKVEKSALSSTGILAHDASDRSAAENEAVSVQNTEDFFKAADASVKNRRNAAVLLDKKNFSPHVGEIHIPIILMKYPDKDFVLGDGDKAKLYEVFEEFFNGTETRPYSVATKLEGYGSVRQYFVEASNGKFTPIFDLYGPYETDRTRKCYGKSSGQSSAILTEAVRKADKDIDFSKYDSNNDGNVDLVYVLYAGTGANLSSDNSDIWPSCWFNRYITTNEHKIVNVIGATNELASQNYNGRPVRAGIGVFCHEMSHGMGLPDLYWTLASKPRNANGVVDWDNCGPEDWDVMDGGENLYNGIWPCQYTAWERQYMGWEEAEELTEAQTINLIPRNKGGKSYKVTNPADPYEFYTIEHTGYDGWNHYLNAVNGSGMMIMHVDIPANGLSMSANNVYGHPSVSILPADGKVLAWYSVNEWSSISNADYRESLKGDVFPGTKNVTSVESFKNYTGDDMVESFPITNIVKNDDQTVSFRFMGGVFNLEDGKELTDYPEGSFGKINYTRNMSTAWGTVVVPFDVDYDADNEDYTLYYLSGADLDVLSFKEYESGVIPAGTPMVVMKNKGEQITLTGTDVEINPVINEVETLSNWKMKGSYIRQTGLKNVYFISQNKFWWAEQAVAVVPYRAWFDTSDVSFARSKAMKITLDDGVTTAVYDLTANGLAENDNAYNLMGQKINAANGGVFIQNGKKYVR